MAGRSRNVKISKTRFKSAMKAAGYSLNRLAEELHIETKEQTITLRSLQRNLAEERMSLSVLCEICDMFFDTDPDYITGTKLFHIDQVREDDPAAAQWYEDHNRIDPDGNIILPYDSKVTELLNENFDSRLLQLLEACESVSFVDPETGNVIELETEDYKQNFDKYKEAIITAIVSQYKADNERG